MISINQNDKKKNEIQYKRKEIINPYYFSNQELYEIFKKSLPPPEAYYYFPKGEEIIIFNDKKPEKSLRRIFVGVPFNDIEKKWINEFKEEISSHSEIILPEYWNDAINLRFVYATECNIKKSYERMVKYIEWHQNMFPMTIQPGDKLYKLLNLGFLYIYGRDHQFRPIIICQPHIVQKNIKLYTSEEVIKASAFLFQYIVNNMLIPGQIENWVMILNFEGSSPLNMPDAVKKLIKTVSENFLSRLYKCYVYGMSFFINFMFKLACNFLEEVTVQKITILDKNNKEQLFENIREDNIEEKFGGTAPNVQGSIEINNNLFPPRMPSNKYILEKDNKKDFLITKEEYIKLVNEEKIREDCISPYLKDEIEKIKKEKELEKKIKNHFGNKQWKFQSEFEGKNSIKNINKSNNIILDLKSFNNAKYSFHKSINILNGNK